MARTAAVDHLPKMTPVLKVRPERLTEDERWCVAQRIVASRHFARSPLLSKFILHIVSETLEGRGSEITEHQIGVRVFDRPASYRTMEDNIVRNYARQLRRRLADYYADEGSAEDIHIDIPLGGYVPVFLSAPAPEVREQEPPLPGQQKAACTGAPYRGSNVVSAAWSGHWPMALCLLIVYSGALIALAWFAARRTAVPHQPSSPTSILWAALFGGTTNTYIVPSDAGLNLLEDVSHHAMALADYMKGGYFQLPLPSLDDHSAEDLRTQEFTSIVDLQTILAIERLPQFNAERAVVRFPRELHFDDLKSANAILLGSEDSDPWASIADSHANFRIIDQEGMKGAIIVNMKPTPPEAASYASHWNEPAHETFAVIEYLPNLTGTGHLLLLQGLDVAGTQAAAETLFHPAAIAPILEHATRQDGSLRSFEILLRSTSLESNATGTEVIASRIY